MPRQARDNDEVKTAIEFYSKCRSHIEHEDDLINQRLTWLMTLQGLLFTAYGFSMSAEASSLGAKGLESAASNIAVVAYSTFTNNLFLIRQSMIVLGVLSSFAALAGVMAAFRAIKDNENSLEQFPDTAPDGTMLYPRIIGGRWSNVLGMICGLVVPFITAGGWLLVGTTTKMLSETWYYVCATSLVLAVLFVIFFVFAKLGWR